MHHYAKYIVSLALLFLGYACSQLYLMYDKHFDYAGASEEQQQRYLEGAAKRLALGARLEAGNDFEITQVFADASIDLMSVAVRYKNPNVDYISASDIEEMRRDVTKEMCLEMDKTIGLDKGYTLRMRFFKSSGAPMTSVQVDPESCARYV